MESWDKPRFKTETILLETRTDIGQEHNRFSAMSSHKTPGA